MVSEMLGFGGEVVCFVVFIKVVELLEKYKGLVCDFGGGVGVIIVVSYSKVVVF